MLFLHIVNLVIEILMYPMGFNLCFYKRFGFSNIERVRAPRQNQKKGTGENWVIWNIEIIFYNSISKSEDKEAGLTNKLTSKKGEKNE